MNRSKGTTDLILPSLLVLLACLFNLIAYHSELTINAPDPNDNVYHRTLIERMEESWERGENPLDSWIPDWGQGFPVSRYYQQLPHLAVAAAHRLLGTLASLDDVFRAMRLLCLCLLPLSVYIGSRWLGFKRLEAAFAAVCICLLSADPSKRYFMGLQPASFLWSGFGLFTQLVGAVLFFPALGAIHRTVATGQRFGPALLLLSMTMLSHLLLGYIACLLGLLALLRPEVRGIWKKAVRRLLLLYSLTTLTVSYLLLPTLLESRWLNRSIWEASEYWDSYGAVAVLSAWISGGLFDGPRMPVLTALVVIGLVLACRDILRNGKSNGCALFAIMAFIVSLLLFFGRPTWGDALIMIPFGGYLPFHRFLCAVQAIGVLLAGYALAALWESLSWHTSWKRFLPSLALTGLILAPAVKGTVSHAVQNAAVIRQVAADFDANGSVLEEQLAEFSALNRIAPGRAYAGTGWNWGKEYRMSHIPVYMYWHRRGIPAISYMFHTMGPMSDLEPYFDPLRRDHYDLFNVRYLMAYNSTDLPTFAKVISQRPGIVAATVETPGYFEVVRTGWFIDGRNASKESLRETNKSFLLSQWHAQDWFIRIGWRDTDRPLPHEILVDVGDSKTLPAPINKPDAPGAVVKDWAKDGRHSALIHMDGDAMVLFRMSYHPNWRASVDGNPTETVTLSPGYVGIPVAKGAHMIELRYASPSWTLGLFYFGIFLILIVFLADRLRLKPSARAHRPSS